MLGLSCGARQPPASFLHVGARSPSRDQTQAPALGAWSQPLDHQEVPGLTGGCEWAPHVLRLLSWLHQEQACEESQRKKETESLLWPVMPPRHTGGSCHCSCALSSEARRWSSPHSKGEGYTRARWPGARGTGRRFRRLPTPGGADGKGPACQCRRIRDGASIPVQEGTLEEGMATHSSVPAWRIPGQRSPVVYIPWGPKESDRTEVT